MTYCFLKVRGSDPFYWGFGLLIFKYALSSTNYYMSNKCSHVIAGLGLLCLLLKVINTKYTIREVQSFLMLLIIACLIFQRTGNDLLVISALLGISMKNTNFEKIIKIWIFIHAFILVVTFGRSIIGGLTTYYIGRFEQGEFKNIVRYSYGFSHPNSFQGILFKIACGIVLLSNSNLVLICIEAINILIYTQTKSRTGLFGITILVFGCWLFKNGKRTLTKRRNWTIYILLELVIIVLDLLLVSFYGKFPMIAIVDNIITGRFSLTYRVKALVPYSLFGHNIFQYGAPFPIDNGIWNVILGSGIIAFLGFVILYCYTIKIESKEKNYKAVIIVLSYTLYSLCEDTFGNLFLSPALLIAFNCVFNKGWYRRLK